MDVALLARIGEVIGPVVAIALLGFLYARKRPTDMSVVNRLNMDCLLPALIFVNLARTEIETDSLLRLGLCACAVVLGSGALAWPVCRAAGMPPRAFLPPMMFKNYGNLGLPLALFALGQPGLEAMVVLFVVGNVLHLTVGFWILRGSLSLREVACTPMIVAAAAGLLVSFAQVELPGAVANSFELLGAAAIPLMLFALGVRMVDVHARSLRIGLAGAALCPACGIACYGAVTSLVRLDGLESHVLLMFSVLPPAVLNFMFAERFGVSPELVAAIVLAGTVLSLAVIPAALVFVL